MAVYGNYREIVAGQVLNGDLDSARGIFIVRGLCDTHTHTYTVELIPRVYIQRQIYTAGRPLSRSGSRRFSPIVSISLAAPPKPLSFLWCVSPHRRAKAPV